MKGAKALILGTGSRGPGTGSKTESPSATSLTFRVSGISSDFYSTATFLRDHEGTHADSHVAESMGRNKSILHLFSASTQHETTHQQLPLEVSPQ